VKLFSNMVDSDTMCYSTLGLANLQYFTFVIDLTNQCWLLG